MTAAHAQAVVPGLHVAPAVPDEDAAGLERLAVWCMRYSPRVAVDPPDGIFIDIAGATHLFRGEDRLIADLTARLNGKGVKARAVVADTFAAAWGIARYGTETIVPPGRLVDAVAPLPVDALRLSGETVESLRELGFERIGQIAAKPSGPFRRRFGAELRLRLNQALGQEPEPVTFVKPPETMSSGVALAEPISTPEALEQVIRRLSGHLCRDLEKKALGARRLDLLLARIDNCTEAVRIGTARPNRDPVHLAKLLCERLDTIDPGPGIEEASLYASRVEPFAGKQLNAGHVSPAGADEADLAPLVDRLTTRLGPKRVYGIAPVESDTPERSVERVPALLEKPNLVWPAHLARPVRLLDPPEAVKVAALVPDHPPAFFVWRRVRHRVVQADGPERVLGEWWKSDAEVSSLRDYYRVEDEKGARFWLFRDAPAEDGGRWWLHGLFQ